MSQRRLAAIMFTDIVGYDSLLKEDEKKAFEYLRKNQRIHRRLIKRFNGRWLKDMESGVLASFSSIIDAVTCALSVQKATNELNIPIRFGIHLGEVIFEKKDVLGDGVNIASRIHSLIDTHGIVVSDTVYKDIRNKEGLVFESLGTHTLKGVRSPVGIYRVTCPNESVLDYSIDTGELVQPLSLGRTTLVAGILIIALLAFALYYFLPKIINPPSEQDQSVLVLPCVNYTGTDTLDYYLAGMHDAMIGDIGKVSALRVISTTTAKTYKNTEKSIPEIAAELGVNNIIEPSVMCLGDSVCIRLKAISTYPEEKQLWVHDFKVEKSEILSLYNMVTKDFADKINVALTPQEEKYLAGSKTVNKEAYEAYLKAGYYYDQLNLESIHLAKTFYNKAIEIDPNWAPPYAGLAGYWSLMRLGGMAPDSVTIPKWLENIEMAKKLDPELIQIKLSEATFSVWIDFNWERGEQEFLNIIKIDPNHARARSLYASLLATLKRNKEAMKQADLAVELDPLNPMFLGMSAVLAATTGEYKKALELAEKAMTIAPNQNIAIGALVYSYFCMGEYRTALNYLVDYEALGEETRLNIINAFDEAGLEKATMVAIEAIEASNWNGTETIVDLYAISGKDSRAMDLLEQMYNDRNSKIAIISRYAKEPFKIEDPRFNELLKKMNLPLP